MTKDTELLQRAYSKLRLALSDISIMHGAISCKHCAEVCSELMGEIVKGTHAVAECIELVADKRTYEDLQVEQTGEIAEEVVPEIPKDLDAAHAHLLEHISQAELERIKKMESEDGMGRYHFGAGRSMRNMWGLWTGSSLTKYFNNLGINHPDDMSGIILETLWCKIHGKPFDLEKRIAAYQAYWESGRRKHESSN